MRLRLFLDLSGVLGVRGRIAAFGNGRCARLTPGGVWLARVFGVWPQRIEWSL